jgi:hypothetical protein
VTKFIVRKKGKKRGLLVFERVSFFGCRILPDVNSDEEGVGNTMWWSVCCFIFFPLLPDALSHFFFLFGLVEDLL